MYKYVYMITWRIFRKHLYLYLYYLVIGMPRRRQKRTWESKVGKNLQILGKILEASTFGDPGKRRELHISRIVFLHANAQRSLKWKNPHSHVFIYTNRRYIYIDVIIGAFNIPLLLDPCHLGHNTIALSNRDNKLI